MNPTANSRTAQAVESLFESVACDPGRRLGVRWLDTALERLLRPRWLLQSAVEPAHSKAPPHPTFGHPLPIRWGEGRDGGRRPWLVVLLVLLVASFSARAHKHLDGGVLVRETGSPLQFLNYDSYSTNAGFLYRLTPTNHVTLGPIYRSGTSSRNDPDLENNPVFTCLPIEPDNGGPHGNAPLPGALIVLRVVSVDGPKGGSFSMWDSDGDYIAEQITFTVPVGTTNGTHQFVLSEGDGSPGSDPYGHIHGRRFSVDRPGLYTVGFRMVDISTNGPGGGPLHAPSEIIPMFFQADTSLLTPVIGPEGLVLTFGTETLRTYIVESSPTLGPDAEWTATGEPIIGNGHLHTGEPLPVSAGPKFYRLRVTQP